MPPSTLTSVAALVALSRLLPLLLSTPPPRFASISPPASATVAAFRVPVPVSMPAMSARVMVSSPPSCSVAPLATATVAVSARRLAAPSTRVPLFTATSPAAALPASVLLPVLTSRPAPRLAMALPPSRV